MGLVIERYKMAKHFELTITDSTFAWQRKQEAIKAEVSQSLRLKDLAFAEDQGVKLLRRSKFGLGEATVST